VTALLACTTHIGTAIAFAAPALVLPLAVIVFTVRERRRMR
jgi:hypothetical protein